MRLWHKDLINVLPRQQLLSQWRECCAIARNIATNGTPNHILVNPIMNYPIEKDFYLYCIDIMNEMKFRGYKISYQSLINWYNNMYNASQGKLEYMYDLNIFKFGSFVPDHYYDIFVGWHNNDYLTQCYYNLQEKHDRGGITDEEWKLIYDKYRELINI